MVMLDYAESAGWLCGTVSLALKMQRWSKTFKTAQLLKDLWKHLSLLFIFCSINNLVKSIIFFAVGCTGLGTSHIILSVALGAQGLLTFDQRFFILLVRSWLLSRGESAAAAAGISELVGGQKSSQVLERARNNFLYVSAEKLLEEDMAYNAPNPALAILTQKGRLGGVDAFVSHSWGDNPKKKWVVLQKWRDTFKAENAGTEPTLWIDKYSINQNKIADSLACLPVYLVGCQKLVILCGTTYLERLWCLVEIYVFLHMGGAVDDIEVLLLGGNSPPACDSSCGVRASWSSASHIRLEEQIRNFNPRAARCHSDYDTDRLQAVIGAAGHEQIVELVRKVFSKHSNA